MTIRLLGQIQYRLKPKSKWTKWHYYYTDEAATLCGWPLGTSTHTRAVSVASFDRPGIRCSHCVRQLKAL